MEKQKYIGLTKLTMAAFLSTAMIFGITACTVRAQEPDPAIFHMPTRQEMEAETARLEKAKGQVACTKKPFGTSKDGQAIEMVTLRNVNGLEARIITYGATVVGLDVPDKNGVTGNIVLGFDNVKDYEENKAYFGATIGRVANRIARGTFDLDGKTYKLAKNDGANTLHGGLKGFDKRVWKISQMDTQNNIAEVQMQLHSPDMEENFPGNVDVTVMYGFDPQNTFSISYIFKTDKPTPLNLTNHCYFNLSGAGQGTILDHIATFDCIEYTPVGKDLIPTGEIKSVVGTPFDFCKPHKIGERIAQVEGGYDHNFIGNAQGGRSHEMVVEDPKSGRRLVARTTLPGTQFYTGNFLDGSIKGNGGKYVKNGAFCLEPQGFPDALHHANFPSIVIKPGTEMDPENMMSSSYAFSTVK